jgi:hypothetical protein
MCANLTEEAEAIGWYEQRLSLEQDPVARSIMESSQVEEYKHFCMELEFLLRAKPVWREIARGVLFRDGDIAANGSAAEHAIDSGSPYDGGAPPPPGAPGAGSSLGIGSLKEGLR